MSFSPVALAPNRKLKLSGWCVLVTLTKPLYPSEMAPTMSTWSLRRILALVFQALRDNKQLELQTTLSDSSVSWKTCYFIMAERTIAVIRMQSLTCFTRTSCWLYLSGLMAGSRSSQAPKSITFNYTQPITSSSPLYPLSGSQLGIRSIIPLSSSLNHDSTVLVSRIATSTNGSSGDGSSMLPGKAASWLQ